MATASVTPADIRAAYKRIAPHVRRTPILEAASPAPGSPPISLKLECLQHTGSFKARGAFHNLLTRAVPAAGCATASGGNHGAAVAFAARALGVSARIFVPEIATPAKIAKIKAYGAEAVIGGGSYAEAQERCDAYVADSGRFRSIHTTHGRPWQAPARSGWNGSRICVRGAWPRSIRSLSRSAAAD